MTPDAARALLHAYLDGELDAVSTVELESQLSASPEMAQELARLSALQSALKSRATRFTAPPQLSGRLFGALPLPSDQGLKPRFFSWWRSFAMGAAGAAAALVVWSLGSTFIFRDNNPLLEEVVGSHIRSLMADHLTDLASADRHSVKPWLSGRLDFAPPVYDLASEGFVLVGGRLDYVRAKPAAAIVYRYRQHLINVFVWPAPSSGDSSIALFTHRGYNSATFESGGMNHWVVSDLNPGDISKLVSLLQRPPVKN